jgi:hypothetical protein
MSANGSSEITIKGVEMKNFSIEKIDNKRSIKLKILKPINEKTIFNKDKDLECLKNQICERIDFYNYSKTGNGENILYLFHGLEIIDCYINSFTFISSFLLFFKLKKTYSPKFIKPFAYTVLYFTTGYVLSNLNRSNFEYYYKKYLTEELLKTKDDKEILHFLDYKFSTQML